MSTVILQIGGHSASVGKKGSMVDSQVNELQGRMPHLEDAIEHIELSAKKSSIKNSIKFLEQNITPDRNLLIVCKSLGCTRLHKILHKESFLVGSFWKTATLTIDGNGFGFFGYYGKHRQFKLPWDLINTECYKHVNLYQRTKMLYGAKWIGTDNYELMHNSSEVKTTHGNIIFHPRVDTELDGLVRWLDE